MTDALRSPRALSAIPARVELCRQSACRANESGVATPPSDKRQPDRNRAAASSRHVDLREARQPRDPGQIDDPVYRVTHSGQTRVARDRQDRRGRDTQHAPSIEKRVDPVRRLRAEGRLPRSRLRRMRPSSAKAPATSDGEARIDPVDPVAKRRAELACCSTRWRAPSREDRHRRGDDSVTGRTRRRRSTPGAKARRTGSSASAKASVATMISAGSCRRSARQAEPRRPWRTSLRRGRNNPPCRMTGTGASCPAHRDPAEGRPKPNRPQKLAGTRTEPPESVPSATSTRPPATAEAEPLDEPPGTRSGARGLSGVP